MLDKSVQTRPKSAPSSTSPALKFSIDILTVKMFGWLHGTLDTLGVPGWLFYVLVIIVGLYLYGTSGFSVFKNVVGCPGPRPFPFLGTMHLYFKDGLQVDLQLKKKYGRTYGVFDGLNPIFVTSDLDLIKQIAIKDFDCFVNHRRVCINDPLNRALGMIKDDNWRQQRAATSVVVTAAKLRKMSDMIEESAKELSDNLERYAENGEMVETQKVFGNFTMDVVAKTQFGVEVNSHSDPNHPLIIHATKMFNSWSVFQPAMLVYMFMPKLLPFIEKFNISYFKIFPADSVAFLKETIMNIIQKRDRTGQRFNDFLQILMDTRNTQDGASKEKEEEKDVDDANQLASNAEQINEKMWKGAKLRPLSDIEICGSSMTFLLAGYETTAMTLGWLSYALSIYPDVQEKLYREVEKNCQPGRKVDYDMVMKMQYLDQVVNETIRRYTVVMRTDRICNKTVQIGPYTIPKGMTMQLSAIGVHYDEEYWPDPMKFDPERFAPENRHQVHPNSILTFGVGPRICLGTRFAILEIKVAIVYVMKKYQILPCEKTENPVKCKKHQLQLPVNGFWVKLKKRNE